MHSFLFRMPLVINLRKILPTKSCLPPCGYRSNESNAPTYTWIHGRGSFTSRHSHRSRDRSHWQKTQALRGSRARHGAGTDTGTARHEGVFATRQHAAQVTHGRSGALTGQALARTSADTRQPPSQWRNGRVRARALRRSLPNLPDPPRYLTTPGWTNPPRFSF